MRQVRKYQGIVIFEGCDEEVHASLRAVLVGFVVCLEEAAE